MQVKFAPRALNLVLVVALLLAALPAVVGAQATPVSSSSVRGELNERFSKHYLALKVMDPSKQVKIVMDYVPLDQSILDTNAGFYVFDANTFRRVQSGENPAQVNLAVGALDTSSGVKQKIAVISRPVGEFTVVPFNDSDVPMSYTLTVENAVLVDDSGEQVEDATKPAMQGTTEAAAEAETPAETVTATPTPTPTETPAPTPALPREVRSATLEGELNVQFAKHYFRLEVEDISKNVEIEMSYNPQDQQALDNGLNFYVYSDSQFMTMLHGGLSTVKAANTAAGTLDTTGGAKVFKATIGKPFDHYTVVVANDSTVPAAYTIKVMNGVLIDASGQSKTAQKASAVASAGEAEETATTTTPAETTAPATEPTVKPGETYVVQRGDTLGTIARAAYGDVDFWDELCAYNNIANCDVIEVGQEVVVPSLEDLQSGATVPAATAEATPEATAEATPEATPEATAEATPEATAEATPEAAETPAPEATPEPAEEAATTDIIDTATTAGDFEILLLALSLSGLTDTLRGDGPYTVFAPGDPAFASLPEATLDTLLADVGELAKVLKLHVVAQKLTAADITDGMEVETLGGETLSFSVEADGTITVEGPNNSATITKSDMMATNGVIHVLNTVLLPAEEAQ